jgi:hypothetical protein
VDSRAGGPRGQMLGQHSAARPHHAVLRRDAGTAGLNDPETYPRERLEEFAAAALHIARR